MKKKSTDILKLNLQLPLLSLLFLALLIFTNCSPKTSEVTIPIEPTDTFTYSGNIEVPDRWWTVFEDEQLNALIDTALQSNFDLLTAYQRIQESEAILDRETSSLIPDIEGTAQSAFNFPQPDFVGGENVRLGLQAEYEVDLWGRLKSQVDAARFRAEASRADYQAAAISLTAEIASTWYQYLNLRNQLKVVNQQVETNQKVITSLKNRFAGGQIRSVDILRQQQLLQGTKEQKLIIERQLAAIENQLSVLTGKQPQVPMELEYDSLPSLPELPQTGIPGELVERRPDVQSSYRLLQAADRDLASAISNKYPRLNLSASTQLRANNFTNLLESTAYSLAAGILAPLYYGGRLNAEVDRNEAIKQQLLFTYGQTVLNAFRDVENALVREDFQRQRVKILSDQLKLANNTYDRLQFQYFNGNGNYLDVLTAIDERQQLQRDLISAEQLLIDYRISLYRALAGSIEIDNNDQSG